MRRERRRGGPVLLAGLGGFALGAATVLFVVWVYGVHPAGAPPPLPGVSPPRGAAPGEAPPAAAPGGGATRTGPPGGEAAPPPAVASDIDALGRRHLLLPVQGLRREQLRDSFSEGRAGHLHEALDIMAARNTPVMAVEDGRLAKLFFSAQGGNTIYQFDPSETYAYYYAHLERYADGLHEGDRLRRGQVIGYVGTSGNAPPESPHLHFAIFRLTADKQWWRGTALDPFLVFTQPQ
jgi:murein DD-endopeptidase MepM/ murein hydrolase activator NlpD